MMNLVRKNWRKISTGLMVFTVLGTGAFAAHSYFAGDCCAPGAACCKPGAPCCKNGAHGKHVANADHAEGGAENKVAAR